MVSAIRYSPMIADLNKLQRTFVISCSHRKPSRGEEITSRFITLLRQHGTRERNIPFYASLLAITANHLSNVVRQQSRHSVILSGSSRKRCIVLKLFR